MRFALASLAQRNSQALQSSLEREQQNASAGHSRANREEERANAAIASVGLSGFRI
jgi:hypothetical protein